METAKSSSKVHQDVPATISAATELPPSIQHHILYQPEVQGMITGPATMSGDDACTPSQDLIRIRTRMSTAARTTIARAGFLSSFFVSLFIVREGYAL